jgi:hypothetical protein
MMNVYDRTKWEGKKTETNKVERVNTITESNTNRKDKHDQNCRQGKCKYMF